MKNFKAIEVVQYMEYFPQGFTLDDMETRIKKLTNLKDWTMILHDKDKLPNGTDKRPHLHIVLTFTNGKTPKTVCETLGVPEQQLEKIKTSVKHARQYHVHLNDPHKHQYDPKEVRASFDYIEWLDDHPKTIRKEDIAVAIANGEIKEYNLHKQIGVTFYAENKTYIDRCFKYRQDSLKSEERNMEVCYISGLSGTGKTTFAKWMARNKGWACYVSSGGKHPLDDYKGEECIILDDLRAHDFSVSEFLKLTDNNTSSMVGCRYYNKHIHECKAIIITCCKSLEGLFDDMTQDTREDVTQAKRRIQTKVAMTRDKVYISAYDQVLDKYSDPVEIINPVSLRYNKRIQSQFARDIVSAFKVEMTEEQFAQLGDAIDAKIDEEMPM